MRGGLLGVLAIGFLCTAAPAWSAPPELESWMLNVSGLTGYGGLPADVQRIRYSTGSAYINASGIPLYTIGPWPGNPNTPSNQAYLLRIPRAPSENTGVKTATPLGSIGAWVNGVTLFNALDAMSYNNQNVWHQNAVVVEAASFDACLGHPAPGGVYHHHQNPRCLYTPDPAVHSPILGYAFDGCPIYGAYGYANTDGSGGVARMLSSYRLRSITQRTSLPDGTVLAPAQYGPAVSATYPLGYYVEDFEFVSGLGNLDAHNGRFAVTPEYPARVYAYFATVDGAGASAYPYTIGPTYWGNVATDNITAHGHVTISETVTDYTPSWLGVPATPGQAGFDLVGSHPNPAGRGATVSFRLGAPARVTLRVVDVAGRDRMTALDEERPAGTHGVWVNLSPLPPGVYFYRLRVGDETRQRTLVHR